MSDASPSSDAPENLRTRAERRLEAHPVERPPIPGESEAQRLLHELEVHQIELEMQNAELLSARDVAEAAREKFVDLYDFAPVGYFSLSPGGVIRMVNLHGAGLLAIERSRLVGCSFLKLLSPAVRPAFQAFLARAFASPEQRSIETEYLLSSGRRIFVRVEAKFSPEAQECRVAVADLTERKEMEDQLRNHEALVSSLIEQAPFGVIVVDSDLCVKRVNPRAQPLFGELIPLLDRALSDVQEAVWSKRVSDEMLTHFRNTLTTGDTFATSEFKARRRGSKEMESYEWQLQRLDFPDGGQGVVAFFKDITARRKAEAAQRRLEVLRVSNRKLKEEIVRRRAIEKTLRSTEREQAELLKQSDRQQHLLRDLSHRILGAQEEERLRISRELHDVIVQSLVGINLQLAAIEIVTDANPRAFRHKLERARQLVQNSAEIVHDFARELRPSVLDDLGLAPALRALVLRFEKENGIEAHLSVFDGVDQIEDPERIMFFRVAQEALANVVRHSGASRVDLRIEITGQTLGMEITDNGRGFDLPAVAASSRARSRLGLLGMKERVEMLGGTFGVRTKPSEGTVISVTLEMWKGKISRRREKSPPER